MKRRIAQDDVEPVTGLDRAFERILAIGLQSKRDVQGVAVANLFGGCDRDGVNIGARKFPTIFALTSNVDSVGGSGKAEGNHNDGLAGCTGQVDGTLAIQA